MQLEGDRAVGLEPPVGQRVRGKRGIAPQRDGDVGRAVGGEQLGQRERAGKAQP
ncbi:hypothetical protein [Sphingomicrobium astaxanthinifaciens]|uniref:hypothetical protein n=1 Tax=Sphingomicrobium astaxanthinifaciens TaxID=1227949 RepID=UPI001FCC4301|nr:hypothetical protein [Sphingomicrobium astaxanthinifaciens]MCJ7420995.1 hypothetical protein [Sphingomicrobium astaxanthinifaciens]